MFKLFKKKKNEVYAPTNGQLKSIEKVNDQVFSTKLMGDGYAIEPADTTLFSPVNGEVLSIFPTKHAITFKTDKGTEVLLHIGLDTVELKGQGFSILVNEGDQVTTESKIAEVDFDFLKSEGKETDVIVVVTNLPEGKHLTINEGSINHGDVVSLV